MIRRPAKVQLVTHPQDPFSSWVLEACHRTGLMVDHHALGELPDLDDCRVIMLGGRGALDAVSSTRLAKWVDMGGCVICVGGTWDLEPVLGLERLTQQDSSRDWIQPKPGCPWWPQELPRCAFWGGPRTKSTGADVLLQSETGSVALSRSGRWVFFAPHVGQSLGVLAMGHSVETDKVGPGDGSAETMDGILRAEDGTILDWVKDRSTVGTNQPAFMEPWADILCDIWMRVVLTACDSVAVEPLLCWPWPHGWEGVATLSIDFGDSDPQLAQGLLNTFAKFGIRASWMAGAKGIPMDIVRLLKKADQSLGLLFSSTPEAWGKENFRLEMLALSRANGVTTLPTAKPQDGGWKGWDKFYDLLSSAGCRVSLAKGGQQAGTSGSLFGTVRPFVPHSYAGRPYDVIEVPYCVSMPGTSPSMAAPIIDMVCTWHGCFHVRMDLASCQAPGFERSLQNLVMLLRQRRLLMMSPDQLGNYDLNRRRVRATLNEAGEGVLASDSTLPGFSILTSTMVNLDRGRDPIAPKEVVRFGRSMRSWSFDLGARSTVRISMSARARAA